MSFRKLITCAMALALIGTQTPVTAFAAEVEVEATETVEAAVEESVTEEAPVSIEEEVTPLAGGVAEEIAEVAGTPEEETLVDEEIEVIEDVETSKEEAIDSVKDEEVEECEHVDADKNGICDLCEEAVEVVIDENHEHSFAYRFNGNGTHTRFCKECDDVEEILSCTDEDEDGVCDVCHGSEDMQIASGITITVRHWSELQVTLDDAEFFVEGSGDYYTFDSSYIKISDRVTFDSFKAAANDVENEDYCIFINNLDFDTFNNLEGIEAVYENLEGEIPSNVNIVIYEKDGVIEDYSIEMNDNYDPNREYEIVDEFVEIKDEEVALAGDLGAEESEDSEDADITLSNTADVIKEDEIAIDAEAADEVAEELTTEEIISENVTETVEIEVAAESTANIQAESTDTVGE